MKMKLYIAILFLFVLGFQQANAQYAFFPEQYAETTNQYDEGD